MKVGILYIATGKYDIFFERFYQSCENNFLPNHDKQYYVWTDSDNECFNKDNIKKIFLKKAGWPYDTMLRFEHFNEMSGELSKNDLLYFFNANMIVNTAISDEDIKISSDLTVVDHPYFYGRHRSLFPYERRIVSQFNIPLDKGDYYVQGCFNGGKAECFLHMADVLSWMINIDLKNNIIPVWHDESALNWWLYSKNYENITVVDPGFAYPESIYLPFDKRIIQLDKNNYGGHSYLRQ